MAVLLDTTAMPPRQRGRAMAEWFEAQCGAPTRVECRRHASEAVHRMSAWHLGPLIAARSQGSSARLVRGRSEVSRTENPQLLLSYFARGATRATLATRDDRTCRAGDLLVNDLGRTFTMDWPDDHDLWGLQVPLDHLGVPEDVLARGLASSGASPLLPVLRRHVASVCAALPAGVGVVAAEALGQVTVDLARAVLTTAGAAPRLAREALHETLPLRAERYILEHLEDPGLSVDRVAAAHFVSVRQLYYAWAGTHDEGIAAWIAERRLERAARQLTEGTASVALIARQAGFADPSAFSRRFRRRYEASPREWRAAGRAVRSRP